jgi:hypothetical protein
MKFTIYIQIDDVDGKDELLLVLSEILEIVEKRKLNVVLQISNKGGA